MKATNNKAQNLNPNHLKSLNCSGRCDLFSFSSYFTQVNHNCTAKNDRRYYLKNQSSNHHSADIAIYIHFMTPNFLKYVLHALCRMDHITFWGTPEIK